MEYPLNRYKAQAAAAFYSVLELVTTWTNGWQFGNVVAVEADGGDDAALHGGAEADPGPLEAGAVAGEAAGDDDGVGEDGVEAGDELAAVDAEALGEDEDAAQVGPLQGAGELLAGGEGLRGALDLDHGRVERGLVEASY